MAGSKKDDFAEILNAIQEPTGAHPFGQSAVPVAVARGPQRGVPIRQTSRMFFCPDDLAEYDEICNRAWAGEIQIRYEKSYETRDGDHVIVLSWFERRTPARPDDVDPAGDVEPVERSGPLH